MYKKQETVKLRTKDVDLGENVTFDDLLLSKPILSGLKQGGYFKPSPIQLKAIPLGKLGLDLIVQAKSGTGKTCVFAVIALEHILATNSKALQVIILAPTREIAVQIHDVIKVLSVHTKVKSGVFIGGLSVKNDKEKLKSCQIAIGSPGRILHLINENMMNTANVRLLVLDEADKLLAPEFQETINLIYSKLPDNKQIITASATYPSYMAAYATRYMRAPAFVRLNIIDPSLRGIRQYYKITPYSNVPNECFEHKFNSLVDFLSKVEFQQAIIFTNYQMKAEHLCKMLISKGWPAIFISGNIEQTQRNLAIAQLKEFKCRILVSTDLTARGIDAQNVDLIINIDLPGDAETYLHRIGRAGRYGCQGIAVSFVTEKDETAQFEELIDSYDLRIKQFSKSLDDIVLSRNEDKQADRALDDITIEKAQVTNEELSQSLFEYEKSKLARKHASTSLRVESNKKLKRTHETIESELRINISLRDVEKTLEDFKKGITQVSTRQKEIKQEHTNNNINLTLENIKAKLDKFNKKFEKKFNLEDKLEKIEEEKQKDEKKENIFFKWEEVKLEAVDDKSKQRKEENEQDEAMEIESHSERNEVNAYNQSIQAFGQFYSSYYKYYLEHYLNLYKNE